MRIKLFSKKPPPEKYIGFREEWDYDRLRKKPDKYLYNTVREPTKREKKNQRKNRAFLYGSFAATGGLSGIAAKNGIKGAAVGSVLGLTGAGIIDAYGRAHHAKRKRIAKEELERRGKTFSWSQKDFTRNEKEMYRQVLKATKGLRKMPKGITSVEDADILQSIAQKLGEGVHKKGQSFTLGLTEEERKILRKHKLGKLAEGDNLDRFARKYHTNINQDAWARLRRMKSGRPGVGELVRSKHSKEIEEQQKKLKEIYKHVDRAETMGQEDSAFRYLEKGWKERSKLEKLAEEHDQKIMDKDSDFAKLIRNNFKRLNNRLEMPLTPEEQKLAKTMKRFRRKSGTAVLELDSNPMTTEISVHKDRVKEIKDSLKYGIGDDGVLDTKYNRKQVKNIEKGKSKDLIGAKEKSAAEIIEHEAGHNSIPSELSSYTTHDDIYRDSPKVQALVDSFIDISNENGASARSLYRLRNQPGANRRRSRLNAAIGTYMDTARVKTQFGSKGINPRDL